MSEAPKAPGFYWAKWKIKSPGTAEEDDAPWGQDWEVVDVFENCIDQTDDEYLMVHVSGVEKAQALENFFWGPGPLALPSKADAPASHLSLIGELVEKMTALRLTARVLLQNAEGCMVKHRARERELQGEPGWLRDSRLCIEDAEATLSRAKSHNTHVPSRVPDDVPDRDPIRAELAAALESFVNNDGDYADDRTFDDADCICEGSGEIDASTLQDHGSIECPHCISRQISERARAALARAKGQTRGGGDGQ